jgi:hypothetical protein
VIGLYETVNGVFYTNGGTGTFSKGNDVDTLKTINAKLGVGLYFDTNDAIAADVYIAGQGISMSNPSGINVLNQDYYFDTRVTCSLYGSFQRSFQKTTDEPALGALINVHNVGQSDSWTGPVFVGLTESSVKCTYNTDNVVGPFTYKGKTWYCTGANYWVDGSLTDDNHNISRIPGQNQAVYPDEINDFTIAKLIIDTAGLLDNNDKVISTKLGSGLRFDSNDAIEAIPYDLPIASASVLGGVKIGQRLTIDANGVLSADSQTYTLPAATTTTLGGIIVGANLTIDQNGVLDGTPDTTYTAGDGLTLGIPYVHNRNTDIPETYLQLEYLESTGTQYINLGSLATDNYVQATIDFSISHIVDDTWIAGNGNSWYGYYRGLGMLNGALRKQDANVTYDPDILQEDLRVVGTFCVDESYQAVYAFARSGSNGIVEGNSQCKIYSIETVETDSAYAPRSGGRTTEMYPCMRKSDNVPGLYDTVSNTFYTNNGTGDFVCGPADTVTEYLNPTIFNVNAGEGLEIDTNNDINVKLGTGLSFDSNGAIEATAQPLAPATTTTLGGVIVGSGLSVDQDGVLSASGGGGSISPATTTTLGGVIVGDGLSVDQYGEISVDEMEGADGTDPGSSGTVPQPVATDNTKYLRGDATWNDPIEDFRTDVNAGRKILVLNCVAPPTQPTDPTDYMYTISNNEVTIDKYIGRKTRISVPATIENKPVTTISSLAFKDSNVIRVDLPSSVININ